MLSMEIISIMEQVAEALDGPVPLRVATAVSEAVADQVGSIIIIEIPGLATPTDVITDKMEISAATEKAATQALIRAVAVVAQEKPMPVIKVPAGKVVLV